MPSNEMSDSPQGYSRATAQPALTQHHLTNGCQLLYTLKESHSLNLISSLGALSLSALLGTALRDKDRTGEERSL